MDTAEFTALAALLRRSEAGFESKIAGTSMEPAIPHGARIWIHRLDPALLREGQVVACTLNDSVFAHRIVFCGRGVRTADFIVTRGDGWLLCDPPTRKSEVLGVVTQYSQDDAWHAPADPVSLPLAKRIMTCASAWLVRSSLLLHHQFARRVAGTCLTLGALCKRTARG